MLELLQIFLPWEPSADTEELCHPEATMQRSHEEREEEERFTKRRREKELERERNPNFSSPI